MKSFHSKSVLKFLMAISLSAIALQAQALLIDPTYTPQWTSVAGPGQNALISDFETQLGVASLGDELFKQNVGGTEDGSFAPNYTATLTGDGGTIVFDGGTAISCPECYLFVKDGNADPQAYLFDLGSWNGEETITLANFWPGNGAISNIVIFGAPGQVPEPAPLALLAIGLMGIGLRRLKSTR